MSTDPTLSSDGANRRRFLGQIGGGFGSVALTQMLTRDVLGNGKLAFNGGLHHRAKVRRVIQLFMTGGASPMDTFDYKPELERLHGQKLGPSEKPEGFTAVPGALMKSPFKFKQHGQSGRWVSEVFPHQAKWVDEMAFLMAMSSKTFYNFNILQGNHFNRDCPAPTFFPTISQAPSPYSSPSKKHGR